MVVHGLISHFNVHLFSQISKTKTTQITNFWNKSDAQPIQYPAEGNMKKVDYTYSGQQVISQAQLANIPVALFDPEEQACKSYNIWNW